MSPRSELDAMFGLTDRVVVVTGASGALGSAIARALGLAGAKVALVARQAEGLSRVHDVSTRRPHRSACPVPERKVKRFPRLSAGAARDVSFRAPGGPNAEANGKKRKKE
jgi:NAD(P)-dependent dehydrogenase (short-subunit alcohol dehydrogenase family)